MDFPLAGQYQQQPCYAASHSHVEEQVDPSVQLLMISHWSNDLAVRLQELQGQLAFTISSVDPRSRQWLEFHAYLAQQFELISAGLITHRSWLDHLQRMQYQPVQLVQPEQLAQLVQPVQQDHQYQQEQQHQQQHQQQHYTEQAERPIFGVPQTQSMSTAQLEKLNERLEVAHEESKNESRCENE